MAPIVTDLQAHSVLCLAHFWGKGYSDLFLAKARALIDLFERGQNRVRLVPGRDALCLSCGFTRQEGPCRDTRIQAGNEAALLFLNRLPCVFDWKIGGIYRLDRVVVQEIRAAASGGLMRSMCAATCLNPADCDHKIQYEPSAFLLYKARGREEGTPKAGVDLLPAMRSKPVRTAMRKEPDERSQSYTDHGRIERIGRGAGL